MRSTSSAARRRRLQLLAVHPHTPVATRRRIESALDRTPRTTETTG